jgi:hypothetical protein
MRFNSKNKEFRLELSKCRLPIAYTSGPTINIDIYFIFNTDSVYDKFVGHILLRFLSFPCL